MPLSVTAFRLLRQVDVKSKGRGGWSHESLALLVASLLLVFPILSLVFSSPSLGASSPLAPGVEKEVIYREDFESGFARFWLGSAKVEDDGSSRVLSVERTGGGEELLAVEYSGGLDWQDILLETNMKGITGDAASLAFRATFQSILSHYFLTLHFPSREIELQKLLNFASNGSVEIISLARTAADVELGLWHTVVVNATGGRIRASIDGLELIDVIDPEPLLYGTIGFSPMLPPGEPPRHLHVDDVRVRATVRMHSTWTQLNGPDGGQVQAIAVDPNNPDIVYAASPHGGIFKSTNKGASWVEVGYTNGLGGTKTADLAIFSSNPSTIHAATVSPGPRVGGAWSSDDGGLHWKQLLGGTNIGLEHLAVHPNNPAIVYAGIQRPGLPEAPEDPGLFRTTDGGDTWTRVMTGEVQDISIASSDPNIIYVGTSDRGVVKSVDGGDSWAEANEGIDYDPLPTNAINRIIIDPQNPDVAIAHQGYVAPGIGDRGPGDMYLTTDGGSGWRLMPAPLNVVDLAMASSTPDVLYVAGTVGNEGEGLVYMSEDLGENWTLITQEALESIPQVLTVDPTNPDILYVGTFTRGVYRTTDGGTTWTRADAGFLGGGQIGLALHPYDNNIIFATSNVYGIGWDRAAGTIEKSTDGGKTWVQVEGSPSSVVVIAVDPVNPDVIYAGTGEGSAEDAPPNATVGFSGVYKSIDSGDTWTAINEGLTFGSVSSLMINSSDTATVFAGTGVRAYGGGLPGAGIFKSTDAGETWRKVNMSDLSVQAIVMDPQSNNIVYAATMGGGVYKSTDGGENWFSADSGLDNLMIYAVAIDPGNPDTLYAGSNPFYGTGQDDRENAGVYKSEDAGGTWNHLPLFAVGANSVEHLMVDPLDSRNIYVAGHNSGWFWSPDSGMSWIWINEGFTRHGTHNYPFAAAFDASRQVIISGTCGRGLFINHLTEREPTLPLWMKVRFEDEVFNVLIESNSTVSDFFFNQPSKLLRFNADGETGTDGFANVTIPHELLGGPYTVLIDDSPVEFEVATTDTTSSLHFAYSHSAREVEVIGETVVAGSPSAPRNLEATVGDRQVDLAWNSPADDGGSPVTGYRIYRGTMSGDLSLLVEVGVILTYADTSVTNGVTYYYMVSAANAVGEGPLSNEASATPIALDTERPTVTISTPTDGAILTSTSVTVSGTASDNVAVEKVEVSWDGTSWLLATGTTTWSASLTLDIGSNTIYVRATDTSGNLETASIGVAVVINTPPTAAIFVSPPTGDVDTLFTADASSSSDAEDPPEALEVRWDWEADGAWDTSWSTEKTAQHQYAEPGAYTIRLQIIDSGGLMDTTTKEVVVASAPVDTTKPAIAVASPRDEATLASLMVAVSGTASDDVAVEKVELSTDATNWVQATGTTSWSGTLGLTEGLNTIYVRATDAAGNTETETIHVTVETAPPTQEPSGADFSALLPLIAVVAIAVAFLSILAIWRMRSTERKGH